MEPYAVVESGGKQYLVKSGDTVRVERIESTIGQELDLKPVLAISDGKELAVGTPDLAAASVKAKVIEHIRGDKVVAYKKKRRKGYAKIRGHRQELTVLQVTSVGA